MPMLVFSLGDGQEAVVSIESSAGTLLDMDRSQNLPHAFGIIQELLNLQLLAVLEA